MASDEQRSPWFPVQPEGQPVDDAPAASEAIEEAARPPEQPVTPPGPVPSFDDVFAPAPERPFELTPSRPTTAQIPHVTPQPPTQRESLQEQTPPMPQFGAPEAWAPQTPAVQAPAPEALAPQTPTAQTPTAQTPTAQTPAVSPYLRMDRQGAPESPYAPPARQAFEPEWPAPEPAMPEPAVPEPAVPEPAVPEPAELSSPEPPRSVYTYEPPSAPTYAAPYSPPAVVPTPSPQDSWQATPAPVGEPDRSTVEAQNPEPPAPETSQPISYAPWTGAIPQVQLPTPTPEPEPVPTPTPAPAPEPGPEPEAAVEVEAVPALEPDPYREPRPTRMSAFEPMAPGRAPEAPLSPEPEPVVPQSSQANGDEADWLVGGLVPTPIEAEDGEIVAPVLPPDAAEIQPRGADPLRESARPVDAPIPARAPSLDSAQEYVPDATDPVKQLGASALSTASLEAAGAPTPRAGLPLVGTPGEGIPSFGDDEPFVPRFEPAGGVVPTPVPRVSFTTPPPPARPVSPLSDYVVPESDEPAYTPKQQFLDTELPVAGGEHGGAGEGKADAEAQSDAVAPPPRPWSAVDPAEVEFVGGTPFNVEAGTFGASISDPVTPTDEATESDEPAESIEPTPSTPADHSVPSWDGIMDGTAGAASGPTSFSAPIAFAPGSFPPVVESPAEPVAAAPAGAPDVTHEPAEGDSPLVEDHSDAVDHQSRPIDGAVAPLEHHDAPSDHDDAPTENDAALIAEPAEAPPVIPITPAASFFAATAARNARRVDDLERDLPEPPMDEQPPSAPPFAVPARTEDAPTEPVPATASAYTPPPGEWARPAFAASDAVTQVDGMERIDDTMKFDTTELDSMGAPAPADEQADNEASGENVVEGVKQKKPRKTWRLVMWIALVALVAAAAGILAYRLFFLPDPVILPVPTATAPAPTPTAQPAEITDASDFVAAMPTTVGTDVLVDYVVTDTLGDTTLPARAAEHVTLTYGPGGSSKVFTVEAYQQYNEADAMTAYDSYAEGATDIEDVVVDGATVGQRAYSTLGSTGTVVWRNGTAVFDLTGPADEVLSFFEHFGL